MKYSVLLKGLQDCKAAVCCVWLGDEIIVESEPEETLQLAEQACLMGKVENC